MSVLEERLADYKAVRADLVEAALEGSLSLKMLGQIIASDLEGRIFEPDDKDPMAVYQFKILFEAFLQNKGWDLERLSEESGIDLRGLRGERRPAGSVEKTRTKLREKDQNGKVRRRISVKEDYTSPSDICAAAMGYDCEGRDVESLNFMMVVGAYFDSIPPSFGQQLEAVKENLKLPLRAFASKLDGISFDGIRQCMDDICIPKIGVIEDICENHKLSQGDKRDLWNGWNEAQVGKIFKTLARGKGSYNNSVRGWEKLLEDVGEFHGYSDGEFPVDDDSKPNEEGLLKYTEQVEVYIELLPLLNVSQQEIFRQVYSHSVEAKEMEEYVRGTNYSIAKKRVKWEEKRIANTERVFVTIVEDDKKYDGIYGFAKMFTETRLGSFIRRTDFGNITKGKLSRLERTGHVSKKIAVGDLIDEFKHLTDLQKDVMEAVYERSAALKNFENPRAAQAKLDGLLQRIRDEGPAPGAPGATGAGVDAKAQGKVSSTVIV